jgi:hypothetical protein
VLVSLPVAPGHGAGDSLLARAHAQQAARSDTLVKQAGPPRHGGVARLVPELTIGVVEGPAEYTFASVNDVLELRDGSVLVLEVPAPGTPSLRKYDAGGRLVRNIGGQGQGPGEFRGPNGLTQLADGRILLYDSPGRRINVYSAEGESTDTWLLPPLPVSSGGADNLRAAPSGALYLLTSLLDRSATNPNVRFRRVVLRLRSDGAVIDTVSPDLPEVEVPSVTRTQVSGSGTATSSFTAPYSPQAVWTWSPLGYLVSGITNRYAFELRIPPAPGTAGGVAAGVPARWRAGDAVLSIRRTTQAVAVSRAERADQRARLQAQLEAAPGTISGSMPEIPGTKPAYKRLQVDEGGRIWVQISMPSEKYDPEKDPTPGQPGAIMGGGFNRGGVSTSSQRGLVPPAPWREPAVYDVFEADGTYIGQVGVPYDTRIMRMRGDRVWGVVRNEDDVPVVKRFRIAWN